MAEQLGYKVIGTVKSVKGHCSAGHKVGDRVKLECMDKLNAVTIELQRERWHSLLSDRSNGQSHL